MAMLSVLYYTLYNTIHTGYTLQTSTIPCRQACCQCGIATTHHHYLTRHTCICECIDGFLHWAHALTTTCSVRLIGVGRMCDACYVYRHCAFLLP